MKSRFIKIFSLENDVENFDKIHATIEKDINFRGTNIWILMFAIIVASVGLNMNSPAVIIGAMLISPLMGPINGMGYSLATYNFFLFRRSLKNFLFAVIASLIASSLYFLISPISYAHSELLARTSPTIYDVLIALFGGLAGIVAITSKQKGNVIPGVAIATALMPPLCTAGYGLATRQFFYFFGAMYLFIINSVFIALSSIAISQILKFPIRSDIADVQKKRINRWITVVIVVTIIPSIYFGYRLVEKERFAENARKFIDEVAVFNGNYLLRNEVNPSKKSITLIYGGNPISENDRSMIKLRLKDFSLEKTKLIIRQGFSLGEINKENTQEDKLNAEVNRLTMLLKKKDKQEDSLVHLNMRGKQLLSEIKTIYPQVYSCTYAETFVFSADKPQPQKVAIVSFGQKAPFLKSIEKKRIQEWLKTRVVSDSMKTYFE